MCVLNRRFILIFIKYRNVFLTNEKLKLGDFGIAVQIPKDDKAQSGCAGTPLYISPEIYKQIRSGESRTFSIRTDCW